MVADALFSLQKDLILVPGLILFAWERVGYSVLLESISVEEVKLENLFDDIFLVDCVEVIRLLLLKIFIFIFIF